MLIVFVTSSTFSAIRWYSSYGAVSGCNFTNNTANYGGAIDWYGSYGAVSGCNFTNNTANVGGAIYWYSSYGAVSGCNFTNNTANNYGGCVTLGKLLNLSVLQSLHLSNEDHNSIYLTGF